MNDGHPDRPELITEPFRMLHATFRSFSSSAILVAAVGTGAMVLPENLVAPVAYAEPMPIAVTISASHGVERPSFGENLSDDVSAPEILGLAQWEYDDLSP